MDGLYICGNCLNFLHCKKREEMDYYDFPCDEPLFLNPVR